MKFSIFTVGLLAALVPVSVAWTKEDREIFRVRDELAAALGPDVTFYGFMGVPPSASLDDINKAYRKRSRALHPDKVKQQLAAERAQQKKTPGGNNKKKPGLHVAKPPSANEVKAAVKKASDMQARLSIVANILRGPERDRYDHFLANGFPVWKGTEYYYNRYRPGFGTVLVGLFIFVGGGAHYVVLYTSWKRRREFVERYIRSARQKAWGSTVGAGVLGGLGLDGVGSDADTLLPAQQHAGPTAADDEQPQQPQAVNRKQRRMQERDAKRESARESAAVSGRRGVAARRAGAAAGIGNANTLGGSGTATPTQQGAGPSGAKRRVVAENGKVLVVDSLGDVYLEEVDEEGNIEELLLDVNEVACPTFRDTAVYRLPAWAYGATLGRLTLGGKRVENEAPQVATASSSQSDAFGITEEDEDSSIGKATPSTDSNDEYELLDKPSLVQAVKNNRQRSNKRKGRKK